MERTPQKAPLPCYGLEHDKHDPVCQQCPHAKGCHTLMGSRADKIPLNRVKFLIVPEAFREDVIEMSDPELPHLQRLYADCFNSVFHRHTTDNISQFKTKIITNAQKAACSIRMFMLANMVAHQVHEQSLIDHTEKARSAIFRGKLLTSDFAVKRAETYQAMCRDRFGTFSLSSLAVLTDDDKINQGLEATLLRSELTAAEWIVRYKIFNSGPATLALYESEELQLAPEWLALEETYIEQILKPYSARKIRSTEVIERHRFDAFQVHGYYKRHLSAQRFAWKTRQRIMPRVVEHVLSRFNLRADDFLYPREAVTNALNFWKTLALTIRHYHCWLFLNGESSYFTPRRNEILVRRS